ncbi:hypothetical protein H6F32_05150 [Anabaena sp. FACHB-1237]|uniref:hypothetical protein n=1 Tax=Anabaena sp. FACHB-1237 TaxID=2692769 RepID=UPI00168104D3|nr:hypothetical protein [Anabaena sp. FACHB-1237]MBD2136985.1 hypothetical protein [Anabaena sp. FACHB-1237]
MKNFSLTLYAFHLRHTFAHTPDQVVEKSSLIWDNLADIGLSAFPATSLKDFKSNLICYENGKYTPQKEIGRKTEWLTNSQDLDLGSFSTTDGFQINVNLEPFLFNDTYAVDLTLLSEPANIDINISQIQHFKPSCFLPYRIQASLGQTLWIYGEVDTNNTYQDCQLLAEKIANALVAGTNLNPVFRDSGELFASSLFIYQANDLNEPNNPVKQSQILILLNNQLNNQQANTVQLITDAYEWLLNLLCCYHKILFINYQASQSYTNARSIYSDLEKQIQYFQDLISNKIKISDLNKLLSEIPQKSFDYTRCLQDLQIHNTSVQTNINNYRICLDKITAINNKISPQFWQNFLDKECQKSQEQIQTDINYLTPGQELFGQFVDTIRGIVETEQAKSDRSLETTVQVLGIGFGGGAIISGVIVQHIDKINQPIPIISPNSPPNPFYASLFLSVIATIVFISFGWLITIRK